MSATGNLLNLLKDTNSSVTEDQTLGSMASHVGCSRYHLHRKISKILGETPKKYTSRVRLQRAAATLAKTNDSVLAIALESGFESHEVFSRAFKRLFGRTPRNFRKRMVESYSYAERSRHHMHVQNIAPCISLYRIPKSQYRTINNMPTESIVKKEIEAQPILFIQRKIAQTQLQPTMAECFGALFGYGVKSGFAIAGQPIARYINTGPGLWTVDFIMPLANSAEPEGEMQAGFLYEGSVAVAVHKGPYEELPETNAAVERWIEEKGLTANGPPWESYVTSPAEIPDPANWITEVYWPVSAEDS